MPDTGIANYIPRPTMAQRSSLDSEYRDHRTALNRSQLASAALLSAVADYPRPLFVAEQKALQDAQVAFAEHLAGILHDFEGNATGSFLGRADDMGLRSEYEARFDEAREEG